MMAQVLAGMPVLCCSRPKLCLPAGHHADLTHATSSAAMLWHLVLVKLVVSPGRRHVPRSSLTVMQAEKPGTCATGSPSTPIGTRVSACSTSPLVVIFLQDKQSPRILLSSQCILLQCHVSGQGLLVKQPLNCWGSDKR